MVPVSRLAEMSPNVLVATLLMDSRPTPKYARSTPMAAREPEVTPNELASRRQARNPAVGTSESPHEGEADIGLSCSRCPQRASSPWRRRRIRRTPQNGPPKPSEQPYLLERPVGVNSDGLNVRILAVRTPLVGGEFVAEPDHGIDEIVDVGHFRSRVDEARTQDERPFDECGAHHDRCLTCQATQDLTVDAVPVTSAAAR